MNGQGWWYFTRASGIVAWVLLAGSVVLGTLQSARATRGRTAVWHVDLHRGLSGLACWSIAAHVVGLLADSFAGFTLGEVLVPLQRDADRWGVTWGVIALYVVVALEVTSLATRRLSHRTWRRVHYLGLGVFWLTTLHGVLVGTDTANWFLRLTAGALVGGVAASTIVRAVRGQRTSPVDLRRLA